MVWLFIRSTTVCSGTERACAMRGACASAASGEMSGSSPEPDVVNRSAGNTPRFGFSVRSDAASVVTRSISFWFVGPRFEPPEAAAS